MFIAPARPSNHPVIGADRPEADLAIGQGSTCACASFNRGPVFNVIQNGQRIFLMRYRVGRYGFVRCPLASCRSKLYCVRFKR